MNLSKYTDEQTAKLKEVRKFVAFQLYNSIVKKTPVDTGRARGNWTVSVGNDDENVYEYAFTPRFKSVDDIGDVNGDESIFISNNLPYICKLEYGGYPDPVKKGTWDKKSGKYVIKSVNGFSKQAPQGMVGITMANADRIVKMAIKVVFGDN